ncbi:MAG: hypothetical protein K2G70_05215 [Turicibacter sp.]|nr:hypothetical protein [Turicibacter sp.]
MERFLTILEETMNKSSIIQFRNFVERYSDVTKWFMCSDYCFDDKNKANNVVSFVIYPYILDFGEWNNIIDSMQKKDLKNCRKVSPLFCEFLKAGYIFSFNFILDKDSIIDKWKNKAFMDKVIQAYIDLTESWKHTTPRSAERHKEMNKKLKGLQDKTRSKAFNYKLLGRVIGVTFLASYLKYLLYREVPNIEIFSWMSDRDSITSWHDEVYFDFYQIISHCIITNTLVAERNNRVTETAVENINQNMFHDPLNRVADFICGGIADYNYYNGSVSGEKQYKLMEDAISDNEYIIILKVSEKGVAKVSYKKIYD